MKISSILIFIFSCANQVKIRQKICQKVRQKIRQKNRQEMYQKIRQKILQQIHTIGQRGLNSLVLSE